MEPDNIEDSPDGDISKKKIVLGVVNTHGMKCSNMNRKRRWDQGPVDSDEVDDAKVFISETEVDKKESVVIPSCISDSLKRIQFSYDVDTDSEEDQPDIKQVPNKDVKTNNVDPSVMEILFGDNQLTTNIVDSDKDDFVSAESDCDSNGVPEKQKQPQPLNMLQVGNAQIVTVDPTDPIDDEIEPEVKEFNEEIIEEVVYDENLSKPSPLIEQVLDESQNSPVLETEIISENIEIETQVSSSNSSEPILETNIKLDITEPEIDTGPKIDSIGPEIDSTQPEIDNEIQIQEVDIKNKIDNKIEEKIDEPVLIEEIVIEKEETIELKPEEKSQNCIKVNQNIEVDTEICEPKEISPVVVKNSNVSVIKRFSPVNKEVETITLYSDSSSARPQKVELSPIKGTETFGVSKKEVDSKENNVPLLKTVSHHVPVTIPPNVSQILKSQLSKPEVPPKLKPITLKIFKDHCEGSESPKKTSPGLSPMKHSPQQKQLEVTLKIAKDANTNFLKATMSPKSNSPTTTWKAETNKTHENSPEPIKLKLTKYEGKEGISDELKMPQTESKIDTMFKKLLEGPIEDELPPAPVKKKRGRPRKIIPPPTPESEDDTFNPPDTSDDEKNRPMRSCRGRTKPIIMRTRKPRGGGRGRGRGRGRPPLIIPTDNESLSDYERAEIAKIEAKKEKLKLDRIAKYEEKKAKKLAKKIKDAERRERLAREKAEKAEAGLPQVFEEETRMSAPDSNSRGVTPGQDESQNSITNTPSLKKGRMEIPIDLDLKEVKADQLAEYHWQGSELNMIQEQVSLYLGVKSFKRKYPDLKRRPVEAEERTFLEDSGLVPKAMCDLGLTAVSSAEVLDIMFVDFPDKYEEFRKHVREKQAKEASFKQKAIALQRRDGMKVEPREQALEAVASWNANLNRERREERKCALDLQTFTVHYPKTDRESMTRPTHKIGLYPLAVLPGQYCDFYKEYTPTELMYFPLNTVLYGPLRPNERQNHEDISDEGSGSDSESSSSADSSTGSSSSSDSSDDEEEEDLKCKFCNGDKNNNKNSQPENLIECAKCKTAIHPSCQGLTQDMVPHIKKYDWLCKQCKNCSHCKDHLSTEKSFNCHLCNRGYHLTCVGLKRAPEGRWHCTVCSYCTSCGTRDPGGSDWQHEFKKGERGAKIYQRTLCTPCFKLWRKGKYCQICFKCHGWKPEEDTGLRQCNTCDKWIHKECYNTKYGGQTSNVRFQCNNCQGRLQSALNNSSVQRSLIKV